MKFVVVLSLILLGTCSKSLEAAAKLETFSSAVLVSTSWADGDSFLVRIRDSSPDKNREVVFRLYGVDCMETLTSQESDRRRLMEQARHFGVEKPALLVSEGKAATRFVKEKLAQPFTVYTTFSQAPGRSEMPRYYAFIVTADGRDLAAELVAQGLARVKGLSRDRAEGISRKEYETHLCDLELVAAMTRTGVWRLSDPARLAQSRAEKRRQDRELAAIRESKWPVSTINLNTASAEEIKSLPGIGKALADRILQGRPYQNPDDLLKVKGIGKTTLEKLKPFLQKANPDNAGREGAFGAAGLVG